MQTQQTQQLYRILEKYFTLSEETFGHEDKIVAQNIRYISVLRGDIAKYVYYLTKTDGELDVREVNYISEITGYKLSQADVIFLAKNSDKLEQGKYLSSAPKSMLLARWSDEKFHQKGEKKKGYNLIVELLRYIAMDLVNADGRVATEEQQAMASIYQQLDRVARDEYRKYKTYVAPVTTEKGQDSGISETDINTTGKSGITENAPVGENIEKDSVTTETTTWSATGETETEETTEETGIEITTWPTEKETTTGENAAETTTWSTTTEAATGSTETTAWSTTAEAATRSTETTAWSTTAEATTGSTETTAWSTTTEMVPEITVRSMATEGVVEETETATEEDTTEAVAGETETATEESTTEAVAEETETATEESTTEAITGEKVTEAVIVETTMKDVTATIGTEKTATAVETEAVTTATRIETVAITTRTGAITAVDTREEVVEATGTEAVTGMIRTEEVPSSLDNIGKKTGKNIQNKNKDQDEKVVHISNNRHIEKGEDMEQNEVQTIMSVEDIVAEINDYATEEDVIKSLELSIGENGGSYIAIKLSKDTISDLIGEPIREDMPIMISGNCVNVVYGTEITKKDLLTGEYSKKQSSYATVDAINQSIYEVGQRNLDKIRSNKNLFDVLNKILYITNDDNIEWINQELKRVNSRLSIVDTEDGNKSVLDGCDVVHSLQEVLWVLSF